MFGVTKSDIKLFGFRISREILQLWLFAIFFICCHQCYE